MLVSGIYFEPTKTAFKRYFRSNPTLNLLTSIVLRSTSTQISVSGLPPCSRFIIEQIRCASRSDTFGAIRFATIVTKLYETDFMIGNKIHLIIQYTAVPGMWKRTRVFQFSINKFSFTKPCSTIRTCHSTNVEMQVNRLTLIVVDGNWSCTCTKACLG